MNKSAGKESSSVNELPQGSFPRIGWGRTVVIGLLCGLVPFAPLQAERTTQRQVYVQSVVTLLRLHADAIRQLSTQSFKYSHNLTRHVTALRNTFGLLGPMDLHAAEATSMQKDHDGAQPKFNAESFEKMADHCVKSMKDLHQASLDQVEGRGSSEAVLRALDELQGGCTACHVLLDGAAPDVWGRK
ncbi:MAG: hypothetical protein HQL56_08680 [Magnetococcales bacterium]|nr:hypothetical protein [Magnetococcales bacterium]